MIVNHYGIRRSGLHAIVGWLGECGLDQTPYKTDLQQPLTDRQHSRLRYRCFEDAPLETIRFEMRREDVFHFWSLRDPYNWLASRIARVGLNEYVVQSVALWTQYAQRIEAGEFTPWINFTRWFASAEYRIECASWFGLMTDGKPYEGIRHEGQGSSFTGRAHDGSASEMGVNSRWRLMCGMPAYRELLTTEVRLLAQSLFGMNAPWQS